MSSQDRNSSIQINEVRNGEKWEAWIWREEREHGRVGKREEQITLRVFEKRHGESYYSCTTQRMHTV